MRFSPNVLNRIYDDFDNEFVSHNEDGTFDVEVTFPEDEWVYGYVMSFGYHVEVLEPVHIRRIIAERFQKALNFYN